MISSRPIPASWRFRIFQSCAFSFALLAMAGGKTVNVNIGGTTYTGVAASSDTGTSWTTTLAPDPSGRDAGNPDLRSLPASDGSRTCMGLNHNYPSSGTYGSPALSLFASYLHNNNAQTLVTLSGLHSATGYNLFFYGARPGLNETLAVTIGGVTKTMVTQGNTSTFVEGQNYVRFDSVVPDAHGEVAVTMGGNGSTVNLLCGLQIQEVGEVARTQSVPTRDFVHRLRNGENLKFAFLGTSLTNGTWKWADVFGEWLDAKFPGQTTRSNFGWGASASSEPVNLPYGMRRLLPALDTNPDVVFIEFSMNDAYTAYGISLAQSRVNFQGMIDAILRDHPNREVVLLTMQSCFPNDAGLSRPQLDAYHELMRDLCVERKLLIIDKNWNWKKLGTDNPTLYQTYVPDGIHSQLPGYRAVNQPEYQRCLLGENQWGAPYPDKAVDPNTVDGSGSRDRFLWHLDQSQLTGSNLPSSTSSGDMVLTSGAVLASGRFSEGVTPGADPSGRAIAVAAGAALESGASAPLGANPSLTVECSFKLSQAGVEQVLLSKRTDPLGGAPHAGFSLWVGTDNHLKASWGLGSQSVAISADAVTLAAGQHHHAALIWDRYTGTARLFLDGVERASQQVAGGTLSLDSQALVLANSGASPWKPLKGMIDEVRISQKEDPFTLSAVTVAPPIDSSTLPSALKWDGGPGASTTDDVATPGSGTWTTGNINWDDGIANASNGAWTDASEATFAGTAGTVTISGYVNAHSLTFASGYTVTGSAITLSGTTPTLATDAGVTATINSLVVGIEGLNKTGTGTLILGGANSFSGGTTISAGTLQLATGGALGTGAIVNNAALVYNQSAISVSNAITGTGTISGTTAGALSIGRTISLTNGNFAFTSSGAGSLATDANLSVGTGMGSIVSASGSGAGLALSGTRSLSAIGSGSISLSGTSTAGGGNRGLEISGSNLTTAGTINLLGSANGAGYGSGVLAATTLHATSGTTTLTCRQTTASSTKAGFIFFNSGGTMTLTADPSAAIVLTGAGTAATNMIFWDNVNNSIVAATGNVSFVAGVTSSTNTFWTGATTFNVGASSALTLDAGGASMSNTLKIGSMGANSTVTIGGSGTGTMSGTKVLSLGTNTLIYDIAGSGAAIQSGVISGAGSLTKTGTGTLTFSAANTYTGPTVVSGGTLALSGSGSIAGSSSVEVQSPAILSATTLAIGSGKTLKGTGQVIGATSVAGGGFLSPGGNAAGTLTLGNTTLSGTYQCQLNGAASDSIVTGSLTFASGATISVSELVPASASSYIIATYSGTLTGTPNVVGAPSGYQLNTATAGQLKLVKISAYAAWAGTFPGLTDSSAQGDPDHDGVATIIEFVTNGNPTQNSQSNLPVASATEDSFVFTHVQRDDAAYLNPVVEFSPGLNNGSWTIAADPANSTISSVNNGGGTHTITTTIPKDSRMKLFVRLRVALP